MAKKKRLKKGYKVKSAIAAMADMKYPDLKRACIIRGMPFEDVVRGDFPRLGSWLNKNYMVKTNSKLLDEFDEWNRADMIARGYPPDEPMIRYGFIDTDPDTGETIIKRPRKIKKDKVRRERTEQGLFKGTKKELTFQCAMEGKTLEETNEIVIEKFPEAVEKSIRIWYNKAKKAKK